MNQSDQDNLRKLAEAATPGPWIQLDNLPYLHATDNPRASPWDTKVVGRFDYAVDMEYFKAANPAKIIELLDTIEAQRKLLERARDEIGFMHCTADHAWESADHERVAETVEALDNYLRQQEGEKG